MLGGLAKAMPITAVCFLIGSLAISAIPPLNGFVSEWFTYQGLIGAAMDGGILMRIIFAFAVVSLAFGVTFLARPRSEAAERAHEVPAPMTIAMIILTLACIALGLGAAWVAPVISSIAASMLEAPTLAVAEGATLVSLDTFSVVSPLIMAVLMAIVIAICILLRNAANRKAGMKSDPDTWACGYEADLSMETLASTVGANVKTFMTPLYAIRYGVNRAGEAVSRLFGRALGPDGKKAHTTKASPGSLVSRYDRDRTVGIAPAKKHAPALSDSVLSIVNDLGAWFGRLENGDFRTYIVYIVCALVFFLALIILVR